MLDNMGKFGRFRKTMLLGILSLTLVLCACEGAKRNVPVAADINEEANAQPEPKTDNKDFASIYLAIIQPNCATSGCHDSVAAGSLNMQNENIAYANLVNMPSDQLSGKDLVEPFDPESSYLYQKLAGTQASIGGSGLAMPIVGHLTEAEMTQVEDWISSGALP